MVQSTSYLSRIPKCGLFTFALFIGGICSIPQSSRGQSVPSQTQYINELIAKKWEEAGIKPSRKTNDYEFMRRLYIDLIGRIPSADEVRNFESDRSRSKLIRRLLYETKHELKDPRTGRLVASPKDPKKPLQIDYTSEYATHWSNLWSVWLMTRGGAHQGYHEQMQIWLEEQFAKNTPHDKFVEALLTAKGKTDENHAVNFILAHLGDPTAGDKKISDGPFEAVPVTSRVTRLFLGIQVQCTQCHDHPFNPEWRQENFWGVNAFFRSTTREGNPTMRAQNAKKKDVRDAQRVTLTDDNTLNPTMSIFFEKRNGQVVMTKPQFLPDLVDLDSEKPTKGPKLIPKNATKSRRELLAEYVIHHDNFAKAYVNRIWGHFFGRGMNEQPAADDFGGHNKVVHPELLSKLAEDLVRYKYDTKALIEWICNSDAYQLSSQVNGFKDGSNAKPEHEPYFARMQLKAMSPEVLFESLMEATRAETAPNAAEKKEVREEWMNKLVRNFGDDEGNEMTFNGTIVQALLMMNGRELNSEISRQGSSVVDSIVKKIVPLKGGVRQIDPKTHELPILTDLYYSALGRPPRTTQTLVIDELIPNGKGKTQKVTTSEVKFIQDRLSKAKNTPEFSRDPMAGYRAFYEDVLWALLNTNEFILNH
jgi:hypothetical protein